MEASQVASLGEMPLEKEIEGVLCVHLSFTKQERAGKTGTILPALIFCVADLQHEP